MERRPELNDKLNGWTRIKIFEKTQVSRIIKEYFFGLFKKKKKKKEEKKEIIFYHPSTRVSGENVQVTLQRSIVVSRWQ